MTGKTYIERFGEEYLRKIHSEFISQGKSLKDLAMFLGVSRMLLSSMYVKTLGINTPNAIHHSKNVINTRNAIREGLSKSEKQKEAKLRIQKNSKNQHIKDMYSKERLIELYKKFQNVHKMCKFLDVNYSTINIILHEYGINLKQVRADLEKSGEWICHSKGRKRTEEDKAKQSATRKRRIASGEIDITPNIKAMCKAYKPVYKNTLIERLLQNELTVRKIPFVDGALSIVKKIFNLLPIRFLLSNLFSK